MINMLEALRALNEDNYTKDDTKVIISFVDSNSGNKVFFTNSESNDFRSENLQEAYMFNSKQEALNEFYNTFSRSAYNSVNVSKVKTDYDYIVESFDDEDIDISDDVTFTDDDADEAAYEDEVKNNKRDFYVDEDELDSDSNVEVGADIPAEEAEADAATETSEEENVDEEGLAEDPNFDLQELDVKVDNTEAEADEDGLITEEFNTATAKEQAGLQNIPNKTVNAIYRLLQDDNYGELNTQDFVNIIEDYGSLTNLALDLGKDLPTEDFVRLVEGDKDFENVVINLCKNSGWINAEGAYIDAEGNGLQKKPTVQELIRELLNTGDKNATIDILRHDYTYGSTGKINEDVNTPINITAKTINLSDCIELTTFDQAYEATKKAKASWEYGYGPSSKGYFDSAIDQGCRLFVYEDGRESLLIKVSNNPIILDIHDYKVNNVKVNGLDEVAAEVKANIARIKGERDAADKQNYEKYKRVEVEESVESSLPVHALPKNQVMDWVEAIPLAEGRSGDSAGTPPTQFSVGYFKEVSQKEIAAKYRGGRGASADDPMVRIFKATEYDAVTTGTPYENTKATKEWRKQSGIERSGERTGFQIDNSISGAMVDKIGYYASNPDEPLLQMFIVNGSHQKTQFYISLNDEDLRPVTREEVAQYLTPGKAQELLAGRQASREKVTDDQGNTFTQYNSGAQVNRLYFKNIYYLAYRAGGPSWAREELPTLGHKIINGGQTEGLLTGDINVNLDASGQNNAVGLGASQPMAATNLNPAAPAAETPVEEGILSAVGDVVGGVANGVKDLLASDEAEKEDKKKASTLEEDNSIFDRAKSSIRKPKQAVVDNRDSATRAHDEIVEKIFRPRNIEELDWTVEEEEDDEGFTYENIIHFLSEDDWQRLWDEYMDSDDYSFQGQDQLPATIGEYMLGDAPYFELDRGMNVHDDAAIVFYAHEVDDDDDYDDEDEDDDDDEDDFEHTPENDAVNDTWTDIYNYLISRRVNMNLIDHPSWNRDIIELIRINQNDALALVDNWGDLSIAYGQELRDYDGDILRRGSVEELMRILKEYDPETFGDVID